ncbi:MAG TPA: DUF4340 domain-containing protein [Gemmatimonadales bacterium]|jgi:hypothetical protein|nr:DUF4340 domain-containing protein [Gemmatimonadales bacterium]
MNALQLRRLALVVGALLVLWGLSTLLGHGSDRVTGSLALPRLPTTTTDTFTVAHGADTVRLVQVSAGVWTANGHPATPGSGSDLLRALGDSATPEVAALNRSSFGRMGVDSAAFVLRVGPAAHPRFTLLVGAQAEEYGSGYVRLAQSDTVYLWRGNLPSLVRRPADVWRDHHIVSIPADSIQSIAVTQHGKHYAVRRSALGWTVGGAPADTMKVKVLLAQFANLSAQGFGGDRTGDSLAHAKKRVQRTVTVQGKGATPLLALTLDSAAGSFWGTRTGDPTVYRLDNWQVIQLTPAGDSLRTRH